MSTCPKCGAAVEKDRYPRGVWRVFRCTKCHWSDAVRRDGATGAEVFGAGTKNNTRGEAS